MPNVPEVSVQDLPDDAVILDVREDEEWAAGHVAGATHVPLGEVPQRLGELPDADPLYVICRSGNRSGRAVAWLGQQGVETVNIAGGMRAWAAAGRPMVADSGAPTVI
jgi:rhodanese-related sulfurtransferase